MPRPPDFVRGELRIVWKGFAHCGKCAARFCAAACRRATFLYHLSMRKFVLAAIMACAIVSAPGELPPPEARQAELYAAILAKDPAHTLARQRLWKLYQSRGMSAELLARSRAAAPHSLTDGLIHGCLLLESGDAAAANEAFRGASTLDPASPLPWIAQAGAFEILNRPADAARALDQAIERVPASAPNRKNLLVRLGDLRLAAGDTRGALTAWEQAVALAPADAPLRRLLVDKFTAAGEFDSAMPHLKWLSDNAPATDRVAALATSSRIEESRGNFPAAIASASRALDLLGAAHWQRPELERRIIDLHARAGTIEACLDSLRKDASAQPHDARAQLRLAAAFASLSRRDAQLESLRNAHAALPNDPAITRELLSAEADFGDLASATALAEDLLALHPGDLDLAFLRADLDVRSGRLDAAAARIDALIAASPSDESLRARGLAFYERNRMTDPLRRHLAEAAKSVPASATAQSLARLEFASGRSAAGARVLLQTDFATLGAVEGAARALDAVALLREQGLDADALALARRALALDPGNPDAVRALSTLLAQRGEFSEAESLVESAIARHPANAEELDRHLFQLLDTAPGPVDPEAHDGLVESLFAAERAAGTPPTAAPARAKELRAKLEESGDPASALRAARWAAFSRDPGAASAIIRQAITRHPRSIELREAAARMATAEGDLPTAIEQFESLAKIDPDHQDGYRRRIANLEADRGNIDRALELFHKRAAENPGSADALMDLAGAQQRADDWYRALDTWIAAFSAASPSQRTQMRQPILAIIDRLALARKGVDILADFAIGQADETSRVASWVEAVDFASSHGALSDAAARIDREIRRNPGSYPLAVARAAAAGEAGNEAGALEILTQAIDLAGDQTAAIERALKAAITAGDYPAAIRIAARLTGISNNPGDWKQLADLQEAEGRFAEAGATWVAIRRRFSRDPEALGSAAEFLARRGDLAGSAACLYAAAAIEPASPASLAAAGRRALDLGDREKAFAVYQRLLAATRPLDPDLPALPGFDEASPDISQRAFSAAMRTLGGLSDPESIATVREKSIETASAGEELRLEAIRQIARLSTGGASHDQWLAWCRQAAPVEAVWGLYETGAFDLALDRIDAMLDDAIRPARLERALLWIALRGGQHSRLRDWIDAQPGDRRRRTEFLFLALSRILQTDPAGLTDAALAGLFPPGRVTNSELWQAATLLAAHSDVANAAAIGEKALAATPPSRRANAALQLASWRLLLRDRTAALATLKSATLAGTGPPGFDQPAFAALRMRWLLSDPGERREIWRETESAPARDPASRHASLALLAALASDDDRAARQADALVTAWLARAGTSDFATPFDSILRSSVLQLHAWRLSKLALAICGAAGQADRALIALRGASVETWPADLALSSVLSQLMTTPAREIPFVIDRGTATGFDASLLATLARQLDAHGHPAAATRVRESLHRRFPGDPSALPDLIAAAARAHDDQRRAQLIAELIDSGSLSHDFQALSDQTNQLADLLIRLGDPRRALGSLARPLALAPADSSLVKSKDRALEALGDTAARLALAQSQVPYDPAAGTITLAKLLMATGRESQAGEIVRGLMASTPSSAPESGEVLYEIAIVQEDAGAAGNLLRQMASRDDWPRVCRLAPRLAAIGRADAAAAILRQGLAAAGRPEDRFACGAALLHILAPLPIEGAEPILAQTRAAAAKKPELFPTYHQLEMSAARSDPDVGKWLRERLETEWRHGAGDRLAGEKLIQLDAVSHAGGQLAKRLDEFLTPRHFNEPSLTGLAQLLAASNRHAEAARVYGILAARLPDKPAATFNQARELWRAGERAAALRAVEPWRQARWLDPAIHLELADFFASIERNDRAAEFYSEIVAGDASAANFPVWLKLARVTRAGGRLDAAALYLKAAFASPENTDSQAVVDFHKARGNLAALDPAANEFALAPPVWRKVRIGIAAALAAAGHPKRAMDWLPPETLADPAAAGILLGVASSNDPALTAEAANLWDAAIRQLPKSRALDGAFAQFLSARAASASISAEQRLEWLATANKLSPGQGAIAQTLAALLHEQGRDAGARKVLEALILTDASAADRAAARKTLSVKGAL